MQEIKEEIENKGTEIIKRYFNLTDEELSNLNREILYHIFQRAKLGMQVIKEMNLMRRAVEMNQIRIMKLISQDKEELQKLIKKSLPQYLK